MHLAERGSNCRDSPRNAYGGGGRSGQDGSNGGGAGGGRSAIQINGNDILTAGGGGGAGYESTGLVRATADNRRRTGHAARRERCHTEPGVGRDGRACARLATTGGPPRGAPARMASCRHGGEARVRIGARLANRGGQSARRGRRVIGGWVRRSGITCSRGGLAIRAARSTVEGVLHTARSGGLDQKVVGWVRSGRARFERSAAYLMRVGAAEVERRRRRTVDLHREIVTLRSARSAGALSLQRARDELSRAREGFLTSRTTEDSVAARAQNARLAIPPIPLLSPCRGAVWRKCSTPTWPLPQEICEAVQYLINSEPT